MVIDNVLLSRRSRRLAAAIVLGICLSPRPSSAADTLDEVVKQALRYSPLVRVAQAQHRAMQANVQAAQAAFMPSVDGEVSSTVRKTVAELASKDAAREHSIGLLARHTLYDGGVRGAELARERARSDAMQAREREMREKVSMNTIEVYANVLSARGMLALAEENLAAHRTVVGKMRTIVKADPGRKFELSQAESRLALAAVVHVSRAVRVKESAVKFEALVGKAPEALADFEAPTDLVTLEQARALALVRNPGISIAESEVRAARLAAQTVKASTRPKLELGVSTRYVHGSITGEPQRDIGVSLTSRWNLFDGGAARARLSSASEDANANVATAENTRLVVSENVGLAWHAMEGHLQSNQELDRQVEHAQATLQAYQEQFRVGRRSVLDVLNAENELFTARSNLTSGLYSYKVAAFQLAAVAGDLPAAIARQSSAVPVK